ncbi:unnamed protein product [Polarella glacialis]|uniref:Ubiquitin-like domain-containing protein n=1 Tax=Polarella glacialis TaxID=89957 RepID=A0A813GQJ4_POLGL|nr:unnamed protein product [Polarella glacialis]|mmetsp:Transcript_45111/g.81609  ORF Transcript_45111/g.81609 Transcript_45111/m.81609 type:complete len:156 (+) Transcript_45111:95-562(+)
MSTSRPVLQAVTGEALALQAVEGGSVGSLRQEVGNALGVSAKKVVLLDGELLLEDGQAVTPDAEGRPITVLVRTIGLREELEQLARSWCVPKNSSDDSWQVFKGLLGEPDVKEAEGIAIAEFEYLECTQVESNLDRGRIVYDLSTGRLKNIYTDT